MPFQKYILILSLCFLWLLTGCFDDAGPRTLQEVQKIHEEIGSSVKDLKCSVDDLKKAQQKTDALQDQKLQSAGNNVCAATAILAKTPETPEQSCFLRTANSHLAVAASALPAPTAEMKKEIEQTLRDIIAKNEKALEDLRNLNAKRIEENGKLSQQLIEAQKEIKTAETQVIRHQTNLDSKTNELGQKEAKLREEVALRQDAELKTARERGSKTRLAFAYGFMGLGALLIVGAIVATMLHVPGILGGGLGCGGAMILIGIGVTVIDEWLSHTWVHWVLAAFLLAIVVGVGFWFWKRIQATSTDAGFNAKIATGAVGAIQEFKLDAIAKGSKEYESLKARLKEWFTDEDGRPDNAVDKEIEKRLIEGNLVDVRKDSNTKV